MDGSSVVLVAFLTSAMTAAGTVYVIDKYNLLPHKAVTPEAVVPEFHGVTENDARANATVARVALLVAAREPNAEAKPGTVIRQSIPAGQRVPDQYPVTVVLSEEMPKVPALRGLTVAEATTRVEQKGYTFRVGGTVPDATVAPGLVIDQTPKAETAQAKGSVVTVQVSSGAGDIEVPKLIGVGLTQAKTDLEKLGLKPVVKWVAMAETPTYVVLNQKPAAKEKAKPGSEVQLTVCR
jgi:serine/threonine-protein kinase